jgi:hypothetical protein
MSVRLLFATLALCLGVIATPAHAKRGIGIINTGDELFEVADFPADVVAAIPQTKSMKVGYKCSHFGLFWADVWTWDCELVGVSGENSYTSLPDELRTKLVADPQYAYGNVKRGVWNRYGFWGALALLAVFLGIGAVAGRKSGTEAAAA